MACRLIFAEPLSEPMLTYCAMESQDQIPLKFVSKYTAIFCQQNAFENGVKLDHFI